MLCPAIASQGQIHPILPPATIIFRRQGQKQSILPLAEEGFADILPASGENGVGRPQIGPILRISGEKTGFRPHFSLILRIYLGKRHVKRDSPVRAGE
jgi:hypothetical protein